jgi:hypothetical protein
MKKVKPDTIRIIETVLQSDPNVSELQKDQVKAVLTGSKLPIQPALLTQKETATWLNVSKSTAYNLVLKGYLKPVIIGDGIKRYRVSDLEKLAGLTPEQQH